MELEVDGSRYFWYHHSDGDTLDKLDPAEVARCVAAMAVMAYVVADLPDPLPRNTASMNLRHAHNMMRPSRAALTAASARVDTSSLEKMDATWDLTVWSEIPSRPAITLFPSPSANIASTSISRGVSG